MPQWIWCSWILSLNIWSSQTHYFCCKNIDGMEQWFVLSTKQRSLLMRYTKIQDLIDMLTSQYKCYHDFSASQAKISRVLAKSCEKSLVLKCNSQKVKSILTLVMTSRMILMIMMMQGMNSHTRLQSFVCREEVDYITIP